MLIYGIQYAKGMSKERFYYRKLRRYTFRKRIIKTNGEMTDTKYFREYRNLLGLSNQDNVKKFFGAKDITPLVDYDYIKLLNNRLVEIIKKINTLVVDEIKNDDIDVFCKDNICSVFEKLKENEILPRLNNQGRRPEEVYFSWMRGFVISKYFLKALTEIFDVSSDNINFIGDDDLQNIESFKRTPKADLQITLGNEEIRVEMQSGFQGINDIKKHKYSEAKRIKQEENISTIIIHFDFFNGQVAFVRLDEIEDDSINWTTRKQMEGQKVFNIDQNYFIWKLIEFPPKYNEMNI